VTETDRESWEIAIRVIRAMCTGRSADESLEESGVDGQGTSSVRHGVLPAMAELSRTLLELYCDAAGKRPDDVLTTIADLDLGE
jgi:hypothetical protein